MLVLDTDHFSELERNSDAGRRLTRRLEAGRMETALTVVTVEEQLRGWLAEINRHHDLHRQISSYAKLQRQVEVFGDWMVLPWDADSAELFLHLREQGVRIGSMDLKIACIVITHRKPAYASGHSRSSRQMLRIHRSRHRPARGDVRPIIRDGA